MTTNALLMWVVCVLAGTAAFLWAVMAWPLRVAQAASSRFALGNVLFWFSLLLSQQRGAAPSWWTWAVSDLFGIAAFVLLREGVQHLFELGPARRVPLLAFAVCAIAYASLPPQASSTFAYTFLYSSAVALLAGGLVEQVWRAARREFNPWAGLLLAAPFALLTAVMLLRLFSLLGQHNEEVPADGLAMLWSFVLLTLLMNLSLVACVVARLLIIIRRQGEHDALTGLPNRRQMERRLQQELARAQRHAGAGCCVLLADLDHFKRVNDQHGHDAGDAALRHLAACWLPRLRTEDLLARWGGEEFLLLPQTLPEQGAAMAERLRAALAEQPLPWQGGPIALTVSLGLAHSAGRDRAALLRDADAALYRAKAGGRNRVVLAPA
ncbi:GGDEF domain-containing protein [Inhella proteolytica]|uniref:diguanylate cyclase n=1 Tax=Inhella proteolytica TaxID=2795029 RepID=A0A931NH19_9BURK|nr:GGDEF domain-containing protein [Inhella proteolytica]MBH9577278.1 GGDEF domain-containing protein [Inhella proteolytica]